jgi:hypothetical protein
MESVDCTALPLRFSDTAQTAPEIFPIQWTSVICISPRESDLVE